MLHKFIPLLLLVILTAACSGGKKDDRPVLTVTIEPLRFVVEAVAGDKYRVATLMPQGASPETYEPTPKQMMELDGSERVFRTGTLGFEKTKLPQMVAATPELAMTDLAKGIAPIAQANHTHGEDDAHGGSDPHTWMSPDNLRTMARNACDALCETDPDNAPYYRQRLATFTAEMERLDNELRQTMNGLAQRTFLIYHPALGYFARQYGLHQLAVELDGKEPSAAYMQQLVSQCKAKNVRTVFISKEHSGRAAKRIADETGAQVVEINPLAYDIPAQMREIAKALAHE